MSDNDNTEPVGIDVLDLPPCLLVAVNVSRRGGQSYRREDEKRLESQKEGEKRTLWTTRKVVDNEEEFRRAASIQHKAKYAAGQLGRHTPVGIVVAASKRDEVVQYRDQQREIVSEFNAESRYSKIDFSCMVFAIRGDNVQELEQILDELRTGLSDLEEAYRSADPGTLRDVVKRMAGFSDILPERVSTTMELAIKAARKRARSITKAEKRVERLQAKIAQELGPDAGLKEVEAELQRLAGEALTSDIRQRTARIASLHTEVMAAADQLEATRNAVDATPIRLARFAVQRRVTPVEESSEDDAVALNAARLAGRVAGLSRVEAPSV